MTRRDATAAGAHRDDLELARRCAAGDEQAWERFILEFRPVLYRSADALDPGGGARELADALYADLYGLTGSGGERRSLFRYYEGRSSLATWLRALLAQRFVDRIRATRRLQPLDDDDEAAESATAPSLASDPPDPDRRRHLVLLRDALAGVVASLDARDRLRLSCYYAQQLTLAQTGRLLKEHEATVSRRIARTRRLIRDEVVRRLRDDHRLSEPQISECLRAAAEDPGPLDLDELLDKKSRVDRSL